MLLEHSYQTLSLLVLFCSLFALYLVCKIRYVANSNQHTTRSNKICKDTYLQLNEEIKNFVLHTFLHILTIYVVFQGWASFLGGFVLWRGWRLPSGGFGAAWGFFLWASEYGDFRYQKTLPLTAVVARLRRFRVHCGERYGSFLISRI